VSQRFGRPVQTFGSLGELRRNKRAPKSEMYYVSVLGPDGRYLRSVLNSTTLQLEEALQRINAAVKSNELLGEAFLLIEACTAELRRRTDAN
jgi:hypothetical protein